MTIISNLDFSQISGFYVEYQNFGFKTSIRSASYVPNILKHTKIPKKVKKNVFKEMWVSTTFRYFLLTLLLGNGLVVTHVNCSRYGTLSNR